MIRSFFFIISILSLLVVSCSKKIFPEKPQLSKTEFPLDSLPESEINIPIQVNLKSLYGIAEKNVDTVFTSPNWPNDWVNADCANRYKYHFRRGPLKISTSGNIFNFGFEGFYKIIGSTRACIGNTVVSPWTPPCRCGFDEGERRVNVNFSSSVSIMTDYKIKLNVTRHEPEALDKCTVCFLGVDITSKVLNGLKEELDLAKKNIESTFGTIDMKNQVQILWHQLSQSHDLNGQGWLQINPQKIRLNNLYTRNDSLNIFLGLTAKPIIGFEKPVDIKTVVPNMDNSLPKSGFNIFLDAVLNYDSLSKIINGQLIGKQFDYKKGPLIKSIIINEVELYGSDNERLIIKLDFSGSNQGIVYFTGMPVFEEKSMTLEIRDIEFDLKSRNMLLKTAEWMFNRKIINEISEQSKFDLTQFIDSAKMMITQQINREWLTGVNSTGIIDELSIANIFPRKNFLHIRSYARGSLFMKVEAGLLKF